MTIDRYAQDIGSVLQIIDAHWRATPKSVQTGLRRSVIWSRGLMAVGAVLLLASLVGANANLRGIVILCIGFIGLIVLVIGLAIDLIDTLRTTKLPFLEHLERLHERLPREGDLLRQLDAFDVRVLESAQKRLRIESAHISVRLAVIGGDGLKGSLIGIGALAYALLVHYAGSDFSSPGLAWVSLIGLAALLGMSIAGWSVKYGASQWDYYGELISFAIDSKLAGSS